MAKKNYIGSERLLTIFNLIKSKLMLYATTMKIDGFTLSLLSENGTVLKNVTLPSSDSFTMKYDNSTNTIYLNQNGEWIPWKENVIGRLYLFEDGIVNYSLTGGFSLVSGLASSAMANTQLQFSTSEMLLESTSDSASSKRGAAVSNNKIDVTNYNYLKIEYSLTKGNAAPSNAIVAALATSNNHQLHLL